MPNKEQVRLIFKETYLLYTKYISMEVVDWNLFHKEYADLCIKFPFDLTVNILECIVQVIGKQKGGM